ELNNATLQLSGKINRRFGHYCGCKAQSVLGVTQYPAAVLSPRSQLSPSRKTSFSSQPPDLVVDESGVRSDFHAGTTWGIRGKTPVVAHTGKRFHLNMLSAVSAKGELRFMTSRKRISAALFIDFLRRLITNYPRKIFLVVDGLPAHKAKSVQHFLAGVKDRIRLFFLPPYSP